MKRRPGDGRTALAVSISAILTGSAIAQELPSERGPIIPPPQIASPTMEEVVAVGRLRSSAMDVVQERLEQEVVADFLSTEQISRTGDSSVSLALRRMPGLTLVNDQFIYVRGLGERYSSTLLNYAQVPSPDLTRNVLPLDIFPAEIVQALSVQKSYSPDMPAAFGGGNINILTRGIPDGPVVSVEVQSGFNTASRDEGLSYVGGRDDSLGTDDGTRALPAAVVSALQEYRGNISVNGILAGLNRDGQFHSVAEAEAINRELALSLYRDIDFARKSMTPDSGVQVALGNRWYLGSNEDWQVGALGMMSYRNTWRNRERTLRNVINPAEEYFEQLQTTNRVSITNVLNTGLAYGEDHTLDASVIFLRNTDDEAWLSDGYSFNAQQSSGRGLRDYTIRYEERELRSNQIRGRHVIGSDTQERVPWLDQPWLEQLTYSWYYSESTAKTDIPSEIFISAENRVDPATGQLLSTSLRRTSSAARYRYTDLNDDVESYGWDLLRPFTIGKTDVELSGGWDYSRKARSYLQTELNLGTTEAAAVPALVGTPGTVLSDANILNPLNQFRFTQIPGLAESYLAAQTNEAAYVKFDALLSDAWRLSGGVRWEQFYQVSLPINRLQYDVRVGQSEIQTTGPDPLQNAMNLRDIVFTEDELYPALSLTYMRPNFWAETFQLRFGVSETVARPDLREISEAFYIDPLTEAQVSGNPRLLTSPITNFDVRAEWFFDEGDNFTVSLFHKKIDRPIETAEGAGSDNNVFVTFVNADRATMTGIEVEWLKNLAPLGRRLGRWVEPFFFAGNVTLSDSELVLGDVGLNLTNPVRRMTGHSEHIANLQLGYDSPNAVHSWSLVYNTFGERVFFAGRSGAQDTYEKPFDSLDFVYSYYPTDKLNVKFRLQNILDEKVRLEQAGVRILEQDVGATMKIDLKWDLGR